MKRIIKAIFMITSMCLLASCTSMNSGFDCPNKAGVMCKNLDQINGMVDSGQIQGRSASVDTGTSHSASDSEFQAYSGTTNTYPGAPLRFGETVQRIWISPFEDTEGNYHQDNFIYAIVKQGHWIGQPIKLSDQT